MNLKTNWRKWSLSLLVCSAVIFVARVNNPPDRRTGAPGEGTCGSAGCHTGITFMDGDIEILGLPDFLEGDSTYRLTVRLSNPNGDAVRGGFQLTALGSDLDSAGTFANLDRSSVITRSLNRVYWEHQPAQLFNSDQEAIYQVDWTAPSEMSDSLVYFYTTGIIANGNGANSGDLLVSTADTLRLMRGIEPFSAEIVREEDISCFGLEDGLIIASASGGIPPYTYEWSNGDTDSVAEGLTAGTYRVTVSDNNGSSQSLRVTLRQPDSLSLSASVTDVQCNGEETGAITMNVSGGTSPYSFNWMDGSNESTRTNLSAGIYFVTVTDNNDCSKSLEVIVTEPGFFIVEEDILVRDVQCFGNADGLIDLRPAINGGAYSFLWSNNAQDSLISNLEPDDYSVTITDFNGCNYEYNFTIEEPEVLTVDLQKNDVFPQGAMNGEIRTTVSGGVPPYMYSWSNGGDSPLLFNLEPGEYTVTVTDDNECTVEETIEIMEPDCNLQVEEETILTDCFMQCDGVICPRITQGTPPYNLEWSNGAVDSCLSNLCPGNYQVTITDSDGCVVMASYTVDQPNPISVNSIIFNNSCFGETEGRISYEISGGTAPYSIAPENLSNLPNGTYNVTITDANGCTQEREEVISSPSPITLSEDSRSAANEGQSNGAIFITVEGGEEPYTFLWLDSEGFSVSSSEDLNGFPADCYSLTIVDGNGCSMRFDSLCIELQTSVKEALGQQIKLYPNPANQMCYIDFDSNISLEKIEFFDLTGKILPIIAEQDYRGRSNAKFNLKEVNSEGLHLVKIQTDQGVIVKKLMIH